MEEMNKNTPWQPYDGSLAPTSGAQPVSFPAEKTELIFGILTIAAGLLLCNFTLFGGFQLGFAIAAVCTVLCSAGYLKAKGCRFTGYSAALLALSLVIMLGFARSDDGFVKFVMVNFLLISTNLGLCLMAGQNRRNPGGIGSFLDSQRAIYVMGLGYMSPAFRGLRGSLRQGGPAVKKGGAVLLGLVIAVPVLAIMIPMLISADAAFEGVINLLPEFEVGEALVTVLFGGCAACFLYSQSVALRHAPKTEFVGHATKTISHLTVNTVLAAVCAVYAVYLVSQLAYFIGGFSGILPKEFTMAEYARRGFFEMAGLCALNLGLIALFVAIVRKQEGKSPLSTRLMCLFIGIVTLFMVASSGAKMFMYIGSYGLTRLRVLTEVITLFLGLSTVVVCLWLFVPKLPYMKVILLSALIIGAVVLWVDVDTVVASYNVSAYQQGILDQVDVDYLSTLNDSAVPYIARLADDKNERVASQARAVLENHFLYIDDFRGWNYASAVAQEVLEKWHKS